MVMAAIATVLSVTCHIVDVHWSENGADFRWPCWENANVNSVLITCYKTMGSCLPWLHSCYMWLYDCVMYAILLQSRNCCGKIKMSILWISQLWCYKIIILQSMLLWMWKLSINCTRICIWVCKSTFRFWNIETNQFYTEQICSWEASTLYMYIYSDVFVTVFLQVLPRYKKECIAMYTEDTIYSNVPLH